MLLLVLISVVTSQPQWWPTPCGPDVPPSFQGTTGTIKRGQGPLVLDYAFCGTIFKACGSRNNTMCANQTENCCAACLRWPEADGTKQEACLGGKFVKAWKDSGAYLFSYQPGDLAPRMSEHRMFLISATCGPEFKVKQFFQPDKAPFIYFLNVSAPQACE